MFISMNLVHAQNVFIENKLTNYLYGKFVNDITIDSDSILWILTDNEIVSYRNDSLAFINFDSILIANNLNINQYEPDEWFIIKDENAFYIIRKLTPLIIIKIQKDSFKSTIIDEPGQMSYPPGQNIIFDKENGKIYLYNRIFHEGVSKEISMALYSIDSNLNFKKEIYLHEIKGSPFIFKRDNKMYYLSCEIQNKKKIINLYQINSPDISKIRCIDTIDEYNREYNMNSYYIDDNSLYIITEDHKSNCNARFIIYNFRNNKIDKYKFKLNRHPSSEESFIVKDNNMYYGYDNFFYKKNLLSGQQIPIYVSPSPDITNEKEAGLEVTKLKINFSIKSSIFDITKILYFGNYFYVLNTYGIYKLCNHNFYILKPDL